MSSRPLRMIVNPAAGGGRGRRTGLRAVAALRRRGWSVEAESTRSPGHAERLSRDAVRSGARRLVVVGGDGTVHEAAQGLLGEGAGDAPALVVCPVGTGNDFHRMVRPEGGRGGVDEVADLLSDGVVARFDVGRARWDGGERAFVNLMGVGVDVEVLRRRARYSRLPGLAQYLVALLDALATFRAPDLEVEIGPPARALAGRTMLVAVTVGPSIGGGFAINPEASALDGKLDLCHVRSAGLPAILRLVPKVIRGVHATSDLVTMQRVERAVARRRGGGALRFELDGELAPESVRELRVAVEPGALPVVVPAAAARAPGRSRG